MQPRWQVLIQPPSFSPGRTFPNSLVGQVETSIDKYLSRKWVRPSLPNEAQNPSGYFTPGSTVPEYDFSKVVSTISISLSDRKADMCLLEIPDPLMVYSFLFEPGLFVTVLAGWDSPGEFGIVFEGIIHKVKPHFVAGRKSTVTLTCMEDMIIMGKEERDTPMRAEAVEEGNPEDGGWEDTLLMIAERHGFEMSREDIHLPTPKPKNLPKSPTQGPKISDLQRLYQMAETCYGAFWLEGSKLKFATYTHILDIMEPRFKFLFREIGHDFPSAEGLRERIFLGGKFMHFLTDDVEVTKGKGKKKVESGSDPEDVTSSFGVIQTDHGDGRGTIAYNYHPERLADFAERDPEGFTILQNFLADSSWAKPEVWERIKEFFSEVKRENKPSSDVRDPGKAEMKEDDRVLNEGITIKCPVGSWVIQPVSTCILEGINPLNDKFYISDVEHRITKGKFETVLQAFRLAKGKFYDKETGEDTDQQSQDGSDAGYETEGGDEIIDE